MTKLIFATQNPHKVEEINAALGNNLIVTSLAQAGIDLDIPEPHDSLEENALEKARTIFSLTHQFCFGEDTGLEVDSLNGEPGVKSARYAGEEKSFDRNIEKLLKNLEGKKREARFRTVIALVWRNEEYLFEGACDGTILHERRGTGGFGYDSVFLPLGSALTFAEMSMDEKNKFSHRKKAADKLVSFLNSQSR